MYFRYIFLLQYIQDHWEDLLKIKWDILDLSAIFFKLCETTLLSYTKG